MAADSLAAQKAQQFSLLTAAKHSTAQTAPQAALSAANDNATAAFTLPGAPEDDEEGMNGGDEEQTGRGLGRRGWVGSGAYVTLQLAPKEDFRKPAGDAGEAAAAHVAVTFAEDAAAFGGLLQAHEGSASPVSFYALHRHENRLTVLHTNVQRASPLFLDDGKEEIGAFEKGGMILEHLYGCPLLCPSPCYQFFKLSNAAPTRLPFCYRGSKRVYTLKQAQQCA